MLDRRQALKLIGATAVTTVVGGRGIHAQESGIEIEGPIPPLPGDLVALEGQAAAPYIETTSVGSGKPLPNEITDAYNILIASPFKCEPIDVAEYFLRLGQGELGSGLSQYAREWPERANPVIFHFFSSTRTQPAGDMTAWCAAFVNWCHLRANAKSIEEIGKAPGFFSQSGKPFGNDSLLRYSTNSASSGSFRCNPKTSEPVRGDLVVMANHGTEGTGSSCLGKGHVAFFVAKLPDNKVRMLGGNQTLAGSDGAVTLGKEGIGPGSRFFSFVKPRV